MKTLKQVLDRANKLYDEHIKTEPHLFEEWGRNAYLLGALEAAYETLYENISHSKK